MRKAMLFILILCSVLICKQSDTFMGIGHGTSDDPPGIKINRVVPGSPAEIAGLETGDIIIKMNDVKVSHQEDLSPFLQDKVPGQLIKLTVRRCTKELRINIILGRRSDFQGDMQKGGRDGFPVSANDIMPNWRSDSTINLVFNAIDKAGQKDNYDSLAASFKKELQIYKGHYTLDAIALGMLQPAATYSSGQWIKEMIDIKNAKPLEISEAIPYILDARDNGVKLENREVMRYGIDNTQDGVEKLIAAVQQANQSINRAFDSLSPEELDIIEDAIPFVLQTFSETVYLQSEENEDLVEWYKEMLAATKKIDYDALLSANTGLAALYNDSFSSSLATIGYDNTKDYENDIIIDTMVKVGESIDSTGAIIDIKGRMIVTGTKSCTYTEEAAIWIDLGGNDTYLGFCGGTPYTIFDNIHHNFHWGRCGVHIDLGGDDHYLRSAIGSIGSGYAGTGCLIDVSGDDHYIGSRLSIGSGFCGCGILIDDDGNDVYSAQECAQGFGVFGSGLLYDQSGDDLYHGARYVQGVGVAKGFGILLDNRGDDRYFAAFKIPNGYGNENTWSGWSQGVGMGFRSFAAGGIGIISDRAGNDHYEAGNFSQACGYFYGFGIFDDMGGDDIVIGNRYVQGSGAHQAMAFFRDRQGDDIYYGNEAMNQGGAWDIQSVFFIDDHGDDSYSGDSYAQGGTAQTAFAVFIDRDGRDSYQSGNISNGLGGALAYHPNYNAKNVTIAIDLGKDEDDYENTKDKRKNNTFIKLDEKEDTGDGIFWDK